MVLDNLEAKILDILRSCGEYRYSSDLSVKSDEQKIMKDLENRGCIIVKAHSLGYCIADVLSP